MNSPIQTGSIAMVKQLFGKLRTINPWHFIWIIILIAEAFTFMLNALQSYIRWGYISGELIEIGTIDALIVSLVATPVIIYSLKATNKKIEQDFTRRVQTENELERSMANFEAIFNSIADAAIFVDTQRSIVMTNPAFTQIFGYGPEEVKGRDTMILYPKEADFIAPGQIRYHQGVMEEKPVFECSYRRKDGTVFLAETTATKVVDSKGRIIGFFGINRDITDRKRTEEELVSYRNHLEELVDQRTKELSTLNDQLRQSQKLEAVGLLAGGIAHDFSNILTIIKGSLYLIDKNLDKGSPLLRYAEQGLSSINKANNLTQSLLAFSRKQTITLEPLDFNEIVRKVARLLSQLIGEHIELTITLTDINPTVMADRNQIEQILLNLATNARDAMPDGGKLTVQTDIIEMNEAFKKEHGYGTLGKFVRLTISDTGTGIEEEIKGKIYEPFFTTKVLGKGSGLGLAVTYGIVKQHSGFIDVETELQKGTTFRIYIPAVEAKAVHSESQNVSSATGGVETILLAEDDHDTRETMSEVLRLSGYTVIEAEDGENAVKAFMENSSRIDLVFLDVRMPKKNGREVYERIKKVGPDTAVLFMSGYTQDIIDSQGIIEEGLHFISKAASPEEILGKIRELLDA